MSFAHDIKARAFDDVVDQCSFMIKEYMSHRPKDNEMADWSKEEIRDMFLELVDFIEYTDYKVSETLSGKENAY